MAGSAKSDPLNTRQPDRSSSLRVATLNLAGDAGRAPAARLAAFIGDARARARPDVVFLQGLPATAAVAAAAREALGDAFDLVLEHEDDGDNCRGGGGGSGEGGGDGGSERGDGDDSGGGGGGECGGGATTRPPRTVVAIALRRAAAARGAVNRAALVAAPAPGSALLSCVATLACGRRALFATARFSSGGGEGGARGAPGSAGDAAARARAAQRDQVFALLRGALARDADGESGADGGAGPAQLCVFGGCVGMRDAELPPAALARAGLADAWAAAGEDRGLRATFDLRRNDSRARLRGHVAHYRFDRIWYGSGAGVGAEGPALPSTKDAGRGDAGRGDAACRSVIVTRASAPPAWMWAARELRLLGTRRIESGEAAGLFPSAHFGVGVELVAPGPPAEVA